MDKTQTADVSATPTTKPSWLIKFQAVARYGMTAMFLFTGVVHLISPETFVKAVPPYLPFPYAIAILSGIAELILAVGIAIDKTRWFAAWGAILLFIAVFPANVYMYQHGAELFPEIPEWALLIRLPLQLVLIAWAYFIRNPILGDRPKPIAPLAS